METGCIPRLWMLKPKVKKTHCSSISITNGPWSICKHFSKDRVGMCCVYFEIFSNSEETIFVKIDLVKTGKKA